MYRVAHRVDPPRIQVYRLLPDSSSTVAHGTAAGHFSKTTHANPCIIKQAIRIDYILCRGVQLYPQAGYHSTITLVSVQIPTKSLPTLARPASHHGIHQGAIDLSPRFNRGISHTEPIPSLWSPVALSSPNGYQTN